MFKMGVCPDVLDTIVAVSSPPGRAFHTIIRISGPDTIHIIKDMFIPYPPTHQDIEYVDSYSSMHGYIRIQEEYISIPVLLYIMKKPYSYTKEDIVEIHTFGSLPLTEMILQFTLNKGIQLGKKIRLSHPGEFTKRAFLNGRIDLSQAEATMRIIRAHSDSELEAAFGQLMGNHSIQINSIKEEIISLCSQIEAAIDFSDQDIEIISSREIVQGIQHIEETISLLLTSAATRKVLPEGITVVLYGKPNAGKSSLMNALLEKKRSLVSNISGTTRDIIVDTLEINRIRFQLMDTAGAEETEDVIVCRSIQKTQSALKRAHVVLLVLDSENINDQVSLIKQESLPENVIVVINKCDQQKDEALFELPEEIRKYPIVHTSAFTGEGLQKLKDLLVESVLSGKVTPSASSHILNTRQRDVLLRSRVPICQALESAKEGVSYECIIIDLHMALDILGEIAGETTTEEILENIFSEFCIGK